MNIKIKFLKSILIGVIVSIIPMFVNGMKLDRSINSKKCKDYQTKLSKINIPFVENQGQKDEKVAFYTQINNGKISILKNGSIYYSIFNKNKDNKIEGVVFEEYFENAKIVNVKGSDKALTKVSYFTGLDKSKHKNNIPAFRKLNYGEVFDGINVKLSASGNNIEKIFYINPGANPKDIKMGFRGILGLSLNRFGQLEIKTKYGTVSLTKPIAYQIKDENKIPVKVSYIIKGNKYGFAVGDYDKHKTLIIDPLIASTFVGGNNNDIIYEPIVATDINGNVFVSAFTSSQDFPTTIGSFSETFNGGISDKYIAKFDKDLTTLLASTFIGGSGDEFGMGLAIDRNGDVFISGYTDSKDFPVTTGSYKETLSGGKDVFIAKLDNDLTTLYAATYLGGSDDEARFFPRIDMKIGKSGNIYLTGLTLSDDFPVTDNGFDRTFNGGTQVGDIFVSKLNNNLTNLIASTYLGGNNEEWRPSIVLDSDENVFICAETWSPDYPCSSDAYDNTFEGAGDICISKLSPDLSILKSSTLFGGNAGDEEALAIALNNDGSVYITGYTNATNFPTTSGTYDSGLLKGVWDVYIARFDENLTSLLASTLIGGQGQDAGRGIIIDESGNIIVTGETTSYDFPVTENAFDTTFNSGDTGLSDMFVVKLNNDLSVLLKSTFLGGYSADQGYRLVSDSEGNIYVSGHTDSTGFPVTENAYDSSFNGTRDCVIVKLDKNLSPYKSEVDINLEIKKKVINGWIINRDIAEIKVEVPNYKTQKFATVQICRESLMDGLFYVLKRVDYSGFNGDGHIYLNQYIDNWNTYTYTAEVIDSLGKVIGRSKKTNL